VPFGTINNTEVTSQFFHMAYLDWIMLGKITEQLPVIDYAIPVRCSPDVRTGSAVFQHTLHVAKLYGN
jgi:hypothetical protein